MAQKALPDTFAFSTTGRLILNRLLNDRELKVLITAKSAGTGLGKTTLAIGICRWATRMLNRVGQLDNYRWDPEADAHIRAFPYANRMGELNSSHNPPQLADELGGQAGKLDYHSEGNKKLKEIWSEYRHKNILSIGTLPTNAMLDKDLKILADMWIHVVDRGYALSSMWLWHDFDERLVRVPVRRPDGAQEAIRFRDIGNTSVFKEVTEMKENKHDADHEAEEYIPPEDVDKMIEDAVKDAKQQQRDEMIMRMAEQSDLRTKDIGEIAGISRSRVSQIVNQG